MVTVRCGVGVVDQDAKYFEGLAKDREAEARKLEERRADARKRRDAAETAEIEQAIKASVVETEAAIRVRQQFLLRCW